MNVDAADRYLKTQRERHLEELLEFLRIPSISSLSEHKRDMLRAAEFAAEQLRHAGVSKVVVMPTTGNPVVFAQHGNDPRKPTVLVYGHYDVQPVDPLPLWKTAPFEPMIRDGYVYARGASDDKGQVFMHFKALEALLSQGVDLPINLKVCIEGEEEIGSRNLPEFVRDHTELLAADLLIISDTSIPAADTPAICYGVRGLCALQIDLTTAATDLHSGMFGGAVPNAAHALVELLSTFHDPDGHVTVKGFYDDVTALTAAERASIEQLPHNDDRYREDIGLTALRGEPGFTTQERVMARPTLEINGLYGGFQGEGTKTVIPCEAHAKITCRLVNDQDPEKIFTRLEEHISRHTPIGATIHVVRQDSGRPFVTDLDSPAMNIAVKAYEAGFDKRPLFMRMGGSIPIVETFYRYLKTPILMMGFGLPDDNLHAPNERFLLQNYDRGLRTLVHFYANIGNL